MTKLNLTRARRLRRIVAAEPVEKLDVRSWRKSCGTVHCLGGLAAADPVFNRHGLNPSPWDGAPLYKWFEALPALEAFFGLTSKQSFRLFMPSVYPEDQELTRVEFLKRLGRIIRRAERVREASR